MGLCKNAISALTRSSAICYTHKMKRTGILLAGIALIILAASPPSSAEDVYIPAQNYTGSNNIADRPFTVDSTGWLHGLDNTGEWLEYDFSLLSFGVHSSTLQIKGTMGVEFHLRLEITGNTTHSFQVIDFNFTGSGLFG